ncbi:hypothetical protein ACQJBY_049750 [Aegilops geniculata]
MQSDFWWCSMGLQRKILLPERATDAGILQTPAELQPLKMKRPRDGEDEGASGPLTPTADGAGTAPPRCPPAPPKKPRLVLGCSLDGFKVLSVVDLRCFLR